MSTWLETYPAESLVGRAYQFAEKAHSGQKRQTGEPYINHVLAVAQTIYQWHLDEPSIAAALLHDVVEDTSYSLEGIKKEFGEEIAFLVSGLTKLKTFQYPSTTAQMENWRKLILAFSKDLRVVIIKLADRLHNLKTLNYLPPDKQKGIALETADIYAPLAYRLGMQKLSGELEDLSFPYLHPAEYQWLLKMVKEKYTEREAFAQKIKPLLEKILAEHNIKPLAIDSRAKRYFSLYKKLLRYNMDLEKIYDLVALRIIVKTPEDCYAALGIIHQFWPPLPGRIKDYIARPKPNGYQSLHTTVFCINHKIIEIQIRTQKMHEEDELGIAAHWAYEQSKDTKDYKKKMPVFASRKDLAWVKQLQNWQQKFTDPEEFLNSLKIDFFKDRIFVITPHNEVVDLPAGATPVDFAYHIHSEIGDQCTGAKVNGKIVPLDYELQSGDIVEILTQKGKKPSKSWLEFIKTSVARDHIKKTIRFKNKELQKKIEPQNLELKIISHNRLGLLKDITEVFSQSKINIISLTSSPVSPKLTMPIINIKCPYLKQTKLEKLMVKLKKVAGVKEISYKFNR